jgi:integrase
MAVYPERRKGRLTGKWIAEVTQAGERRRKRFKTKEEGERWEGLLRLTGTPTVETGSAPSGPTFGSVAKEAREHHAGWQHSRDPSLGPRLDYVVAALGEDTPIERIRTTDLDGLVSTLRKRRGSKSDKLSAGTINRYLSVISAVLTFARRREYIIGLPVVPWQRESGRRIHWLTVEAETAIVRHMASAGHDACALAVRVLVATGLHWSEFASLAVR